MAAGSPRLPLPPDVLAERGRPRVADALFLGALFLIAFWDLGGRSILHRDQTRFGTIAREMIASGDWLVPTQYGTTYANKPILYVWAVALPSWLAGDVTAFALRLPSALALVATAWATAAWAFARSGSRGVGRVAGLLVATTFFVNELGRTGRPDMLATAFGTAGAFLLDRAALGRGRPRDPWLAGLALGAGVLSKGPVVLLVPAALVLLPRRGVSFRERRARTKPIAVLAVATATAAAWFVPAWIRGGNDFAHRLVVVQVGERIAGRANHLEEPWYYLVEFATQAIPWSPALAAGGLAFASRRVRAARVDGACAGAALAAFLVLSAVPTKEVRFASVLVPPLAVCAAHAFVPVLLRGSVRRGRVSLVAAGLAGIGGAVAGAIVFAEVRSWVASGAAFVLVACALAVYWGYLARYLVPAAVEENRAVASVLEPGVPVATLGGETGGVTPDDVFLAVRSPRHAPDPSSLPSRDSAPRLYVLCTAGRLLEVETARGEKGVEVLRRPRRRGDDLLAVRFGP